MERVNSLQMRTLIVGALSCLFCLVANAQSKIYKVRMPDGRILFTDAPPQGAVVLSEREAPEAPAARPPAPARNEGETRTAPPARAAQETATPASRSAQIDKAFAAVQAAEKEVADARQALEAGQAPREGEMLGTARGGVRVGPAYQERIAGLEKAITAAEQRLAKARADLDAVR
jgi:hypothetical protein